jgi:hypothetical protein
MRILKTETEKYAPKLDAFVAPGERVAVAARVDHRAGAKTVGALGALVRLGALFVAGEVEHVPAGSLADRVPTKRVTLCVLTDQRLLFLKIGGLKPGPVIDEYPIGEVKAMEAAKAKVQYGTLVIVFADDSRIVLDLLNDRGVDTINDRSLAILGSRS